MATYLQGVTDYIPEFQPFQPDLNFYANVMQTKQNQYDTNYKAVNNLYGELYDAELTHEKNIEKKDQLLKNLDFELKRVSGLDLSLEQNVNQAKQVFKPFYQDKYLMKDMAYTKNFNSTLNRAKALQNNPDEKQSAQYWDTGIKDMMYRREEFRNADLEKTLNMSDAEYTPYVNAAKVYRELAKEMNLSVDIEKPDASGMYMVRQKNGDLILPTLQKLFLSEYTNNPALQKVYATQAYVNRNEYIAQNAERFKGDKLAAEKEYLQSRYAQLKDYTARRAEAHQDAVKVTTNKKNAVENSIEKGEVNPAQNEYLRKLNQMYEINTKVSDHSNKLNEQLNGESRTITTQGPTSSSDLDLTNMELARLKVDSGIAAFDAEQDIMGEADIAARKDMVFKQDFSKLYMENLNHQHAMQRQSASDARADAREMMKVKAAKILERDKSLVASGAYVYDINGNVTPNPAYAGTYTGDVPPGGSEVKVENIKTLNAGDYFEKVSTLTSGYAKNMYSTIANLYESGELDNTELWGIMHPNETPKANQNYADAKAEFYKEYYKFKENSDQVTNNLATSGKLFKYRNQLKKWAAKNFGSKGADLVLAPDPNNDRLANHDASVQQFEWYTKEYYKIKETNNERIENTLMKSLGNSGYSEQTKKALIDLYKRKVVTHEYDDDDFTRIANKYILEKMEPDFKNKEQLKRGVTGTTKESATYNADLLKFLKEKDKAKGSRTPGKEHDVRFNNLTLDEVKNYSDQFGSKKGYVDPKIANTSSLKAVLNDMNNSYYTIVSNADKKTGLLSTLPTLINGADGKATLAANEASAIVNIGAVGTFGNKAFFETLNDITRINFKNDPNKYRITLNGNSTRDAADDLNSESAKYKDFLRALSHTIRDKSKPEDFIITQSQIAFEDKNLGAMTIKVPRSFAEKYFKTDDGKTDAELVNKIVEKGITFVAPKYEWKNSLFLNNKTTPVQAVINASVNNKLEYKDPSNAGNYTIEKFDDGSYRANVSFKEMGPDGKAIVSTSLLTSEQLGNNVDLLVQQANHQMAIRNQENLTKYKEFHAAGNTQAMRNAEKEFGFIPKNFGWKY
jgi:hypothetical protein